MGDQTLIMNSVIKTLLIAALLVTAVAAQCTMYTLCAYPPPPLAPSPPP